MLLRTVLCSFLLIFLFSCNESTGPEITPEPTDILARLQQIEGIDVTEIPPQNGYPRQFQIDISQPLDHSFPAGGTFKQRLYLSHLSESAPMVFMPSGYSCRPDLVAELSTLLGANQVYVAHRFMRGAVPAAFSWQYLNIQQAADDHHRIVQLLKSIYTGKWVSYGASKNGVTALFHRRFYPNDVIATLAKVAPISVSIDDPRYDNFLASVGTESTRQKIKDYQRAVLSRRSEIIPMIQDYITRTGYAFTRFDAGEILEYEMAEFPFSFWQVTPADPSTIPDTTASAAELYAHIEGGGYLIYYADETVEFYEPVYYQAYTELGWYRLNVDHLKDLLVSVPEPSYRNFAPRNANLDFDPEVMADMTDWLETQGNNIIYIYGANDPWTAGAISPGGQTNAVKIVQPDANHYISLEELDQRDLVYQTLAHWLDMNIPAQTENMNITTTAPSDEYRPMQIHPYFLP